MIRFLVSTTLANAKVVPSIMKSLKYKQTVSLQLFHFLLGGAPRSCAVAMPSGCLYECLKEAQLHHFYRHFTNNGVTNCEGLTNISMLDYAR